MRGKLTRRSYRLYERVGAAILSHLRRIANRHGIIATWQNTTKPLREERKSTDRNGTTGNEEDHEAATYSHRSSLAARENWKRISEIARRARADDSSDESSSHEGMDPEEVEDLRRRRAEAKREREKTAKMMDLQYFLEMVDHKHRYGSNLRTYHGEWKKADTYENFFYWLDEGGGKDLELPTVSRERLEKEQVRYLSREQRQDYLVTIDHEGRLCWAKNRLRISTTVDWKDSPHGIVPTRDTAVTNADGELQPQFAEPKDGTRRDSSSTSSYSSDDSDTSSISSDSTEGERYVNYDLKKSKGVQKIRHVTAATVLNHLLRKTAKPNTWIFVADTSFRLYVGIKQSGSFQHSSFLHGSRISAAGLIKIKDGQLRRLSPLSGHYRPPAANFRKFVHSLRDTGCDMSRVSISRSYAVLVGLEMYVRTRRKAKDGVEKTEEAIVSMVKPEEMKRREEARKDQSKSAERERQILAAKAKEEAEEKKLRRQSLMKRFLRKFKRSKDGQPSSSGPLDELGVDKDTESKKRMAPSTASPGVGRAIATDPSAISDESHGKDLRSA